MDRSEGVSCVITLPVIDIDRYREHVAIIRAVPYNGCEFVCPYAIVYSFIWLKEREIKEMKMADTKKEGV